MSLIDFGSIAQIKKGKKPLRQIDHPQDGYLPYVDIEAFETGNVKAYADGEKCLPCKAGEILIVCDGSRSGFVGRAIDGYVGSTLAVISADGMSADYLYYFLQGKYALLNTKKKGTGTPHLDQQILFQQKLLVPSLEEQARIVARIEELFSELDNGVETLCKTKQQLAVYRQAILKDAFSICRKQVAVSSVCTHVTDGDHMPPPKAPSGIPFIMISNIDGNQIDFSETAFVGRDYYESIDSKRRPQVGDVLYSVTGSFGIPVLVDFEKEFCFQRHIALLRPNDSILSRYLYYAMQSPDVYAQVSKGATGTAQKTVGLTVLRKILIPYAETKLEQEEIVRDIENKMSVCDSIEKTVDTALQQAEAMRQSILKQTFEGRL